MKYAANEKILKLFYTQYGLTSEFEKDNAYLEKAFNDIYKIWLDNLNKIESVKFLMIAEAPLWGSVKKYIYNPNTNNSQFFYRSDLGDILNKHISNKQEFIKICAEIGLLVIDISPFALNSKDTAINYRQLTTSQYRQLVSLTMPTFFENKIKAVMAKKHKNIQTFFRYSRVKSTFQDLIGRVLIEHAIIKSPDEIADISQNGGGIDKTKLKKIILSNPTH